jgi:hypothetical protein
VSQNRFKLGEWHAAFDRQPSRGKLLNRNGLVGVVLVLDLTNDLLEDVFQRHDARGAAEFIHHDREMAGPPLEVAQLAIERLPFRDVGRRPDQGVPWLGIVALRQSGSISLA